MSLDKGNRLQKEFEDTAKNEFTSIRWRCPNCLRLFDDIEGHQAVCDEMLREVADVIQAAMFEPVTAPKRVRIERAAKAVMKNFTVRSPPKFSVVNAQSFEVQKEQATMSYDYQKERPFVFSEEGQIMFLKIRDNAEALIKKSGAATCGRIIAECTGDSWSMLACVDRLVELGELVEVPTNFAGQCRIYIAGRKQ